MREQDTLGTPASSGMSAGTTWGFVLVILLAWRAAGAEEMRVGWHELRTTLTSEADTLILLPNVILVRDSVRVWADSLPLTPGYDFVVNYLERRIRLSHPWPAGVTVTVRYRALPVNWPTRQVWMYPTAPAEDTLGARAPPITAAGRRSPATQPTGNLRIGGSKTFAIQVGSRRDLTLEQSLRVSVNGTVGENVEVTAELSDQNLPIQPEGTTEDLREIDKVLVEVKSPHYRALLGNYDVNYRRGEFGRYVRRLDGAQAEARFDRGGLMGGIASARGRFRTYQLPVIDGNQGPYRLVDEAGNAGIVVIAGTERVWIDGELLRRGENNDYTMEYAAGEITFMRKRLITQELRVVVDYEYANEHYTRTSAIASGYLGEQGARWRTSVFFAQEGDNPDEPLALTIDDAARRIISRAGDDPARASLPGWFPSDSGSYRAVDLAAEHFIYVGPDSGDYDVSFSRVGPGKGSYVREQGFFSRAFRYVGPGGGDWIPRVLFPLPERHRLLSFWQAFEPFPRVRAEAEAAVSDLDRNTLSPLDDGDNTKLAGRFSLLVEDAPLAWRNRDLGVLSVSAVGRGVQNGFAPMSRTTKVEDNRRWGLDLSAERGQERTAVLTTVYRPRPGHRLDLDLGWFDRDTTRNEPAYRAWRSGLRWNTAARGWPAMKAFLEQIRSRTTPGDSSRYYGLVRRGDASVRYPVWRLVPAGRIEGELDESARGGRIFRGTRYGLWSAGLATGGIESFAASGSVEERLDERFDTTLTADLSRRGWSEDRRAITQVWRAAVRQWKGLSGTAEYTWRRLRAPRVGSTTISDVADANVRHEAWGGLLRNALRYRVSATRTAKHERVYVFVGSGKGEFASVDPNDQRAILSETDVTDVQPGDPRASYAPRLVNTEQFQPTVSLDAAWRMNLDFTRKWKGVPDPRSNRLRPLWQRALRLIATETSVQVSETDSTRNSDLYLVKFWKFRRSGTSPTVRGTWEFRQDITLWPNSRRGDLRLRTSDSEEFDASLLGETALPAVTRQREYSARGRLRFIPKEVDWRGELSFQTDTRSGTRFDYRAKRTLFDQTWAYHPTFQTEWSVRNENGVGTDPTPDAKVGNDPSRRLRAYFTGIEPSYRRAWGNRGMIRLAAQWSGVFAQNLADGAALPVRLLNGRNTGHNFRWTAIVNYRLSSLVTASFTYTGRKTPGGPVVHNGRAEVRAVF